VVVEDLAGIEDLAGAAADLAGTADLEAGAFDETVEGHVSYEVVEAACAEVAGNGKRMDLVG
jgi:hypothetical protein